MSPPIPHLGLIYTEEVPAAVFDDFVETVSAPGLDLVRAVASMGPDKPWFAIGGIDERRIDEVIDAGARRIVVVRAITDAPDPGAAASRLRAALVAAD